MRKIFYFIVKLKVTHYQPINFTSKSRQMMRQEGCERKHYCS